MAAPLATRSWTLPVLLLAYGVPALLALALRPAWVSLAVPGAGPWAGRLLGRSCGAADGWPTLSRALAVAGPLTAGLALLVRRHRTALLPLAAWWAAWVLLALGSALNTLE